MVVEEECKKQEKKPMKRSNSWYVNLLNWFRFV